MVDSEIYDIGETERRRDRPICKVIQVLLAVYVNTHAEVVCTAHIGQHIMVIPVVVYPSRRSPGAESCTKTCCVGVGQGWGSVQTHAVGAHIGDADFIDQGR